MKIAIGAIVKNEAPYLREWVAYHKAVGVDAFIIGDNESTDGTRALLRGLAGAGVRSFGVRGRARQLFTYDTIVRDHSAGIDWIAFIDADEFIVPTDGALSIRPAIAALAADPTVGAIGLNWATFGSSGHEQAGPEGVLRRFTRRAERDFLINTHLKSIVRVAAFRAAANPHAAHLSPGFRLVAPSGAAIVPPAPERLGLSSTVSWERLRLNHYVVKSRTEFAFKQARGRADRAFGFEDGFFEGHDRNEVEEAFPGPLLAATDAVARDLPPRRVWWRQGSRPIGAVLSWPRPRWCSLVTPRR
ncbi:glycosyltransferase family 2 protein [Prosthecomicrobium pneumaticum]|uniref:Glycosyl transferase family 2 n=1 Tax=Prosthecomicrobium pneumaticum TaxID=81895 RepID=A0A7W9FJT8_9HYPH|nr:hypothetical protein [Prosthecomicrobium pneumaticum]